MARKPKSDAYKRLSRHLTKQISKANKRYDRMKKLGWNTPANKVVEKTGGRFHNGRNMSYREMQKEQHRVENFLNMKTSTKTGTRKTVKKMLKNTGMDKHFSSGQIMKDSKTMNKYFKVYKKLREYDRVKGVGRTYQSSFAAVTSYFESNGLSGSVDDILDDIVDSLDTGEDTSGMSDADTLLE